MNLDFGVLPILPLCRPIPATPIDLNDLSALPIRVILANNMRIMMRILKIYKLAMDRILTSPNMLMLLIRWNYICVHIKVIVLV